MCGLEGGGVAGARGEVGPSHLAEDGEDVVEGHVGYGFGGGTGSVGVEDAWVRRLLVSG